LRVLAATLSSLAMLAASEGALACACCTNAGQRYVEVEALDAGRLEQIESLRFANEARLFVGEGDPKGIAGIAEPAARYDLTVSWDKARPGKTGIIFALGHSGDGAGTLSLTIPQKISIFEVNPRDGEDEGMGPPLYKEWRLTGEVTGSGAFSGSSGSRQRLTLIVEGGGNSCTSAEDFTRWMLVMQGPKANYTLFGDPVRAE
jgi:hypothetical protein